MFVLRPPTDPAPVRPTRPSTVLQQFFKYQVLRHFGFPVTPPSVQYADAMRRSRQFAHPRWAMTLNYPEGWFLHVTDTELVLRSRDPEDVIFDNELRCTRGSGLPSVPDNADDIYEFQGSFYRAQDGWRVKSGLRATENCENDSCESPNTRRVGAVVIMSGEGGYRGYSPWGYSGVSSGTEHVVIDGDDWVHCYDRLLDSDDRIQARRQPRPRRN